LAETTVKPVSGEESLAASTAVLAGGGELGRLMRALDWAKTPLGPFETWPQSLRTSASICLASRFPIVMYWGPELVVLYNDAYSQILGSKHPWALGQTCRVCWAEIWDTIGPMLDGVLQTGEATWSDDLLLMLQRYGYPEECYFSFSFSPVRVESGEVGGVFTAVIETTENVIGERRLRTLRDLAAHSANARSEDETWQMAAATLHENPADIPFAVLCEPEGEGLRTVATAGIDRTHPFCEELCRAGSNLLRTATEVASTGIRAKLELDASFGELPRGPWAAAPHEAVLLPIGALGQGASGLLVAAVSPAKALDESYGTFFELVARQIATSIADARAHEEERRRAEELAALDRAKTLFFSNVSHELRTPLTLLLGPTEGALASPERMLKGADLELLYRNELRLLKLVNTLLEFSRIEAGRVDASYEPTALGEVTAEIASVFRSAMERAGLRYSIECDAMEDPVWVDRDMWEKIVLNLLSNAFKFTLQGEVAVRLVRAGDQVELSVRDTGSGIPEEEIPRLFERFHRVENPRARTHEGSGIGLALVQELVRLHGGSMQVESAEGAGSTFTVRIPLGTAHLPADRLCARRSLARTVSGAASYIEEAQRWLPEELSEFANQELMPAGFAMPGGGAAAAEGTKRERVLVVDDNADMREYLGRLLAADYEVHSAANGREAFRVAGSVRPGLILTDVMMPGLDGFGLLGAIRSDMELRNTPVILLSARAGEESRIEGLEAGADDYLVKPFTARELLSRVSSHLRMAAIRREATEREARLRAVAENERRRLQELLEQAPAAIGVMNDYYVRVTGRSSAKDFLGKTIRESLPELEGSGFWELLDEVYRTGKPFIGREEKARLRSSPGEALADKYFDFVYQPLRDADGQVEGVLVHAVEVTERVQARMLIEEHHERLQAAHLVSQRLAAIVESSDDAIVSKDLNGIVTSWNRRAESMFGYSAEEMIGRSILTIIPPELHGDEDRILATLRAGGKIEHFETERVKKSGERIEVSLTISPMRDETGRIIGASKIARDITERRKAERALRTTEKLASVGRLAATVAHEINNPLESVTNLVYLARETSNQDNVRRFLATAEEELARVAVLTRQTLGFYRDTRTATTLRLSELAGPLVAAFHPRGRNKGVDIRVEAREQRELRVLAGEMRQLIANLLTNSIDAVEAGGRIRMRVSDAREWSGEGRRGVRLTIADNGSGIPAGLRSHLFEPFFTTKKDVGTGLGLWVCQSIVEKQGGTIRLKSSTAPERSGTTLSVFLPAEEQG
jgi:PAS domain S-box-containing protein